MKTLQWIVLAALIVLPALAQAQTQDEKDMLAEVQNQAVFCKGSYALCIKAPCTPVPTLDRLGNYYVDHAECSCVVEKGISMGPGQCADRGPVTQHGRTFMISTYSNAFNVRDGSLNTTLYCSNDKTLWAWCYGAPCVVDDRDPNLAHCTCPLKRSRMQTLGGDCNQDNCKYIWSAAVPAGDDFANKHFYEYVKANDPNYPVNMPAKLCTPPQKK
jgi:hypothetical protein